MDGGMLDNGTRLTIAETGETVTVRGLFGSGGQGEVYRVSTPHGDRALKWYFPHLATAAQRRILEGLIEKNKDWEDDRFLWPRSIVDPLPAAAAAARKNGTALSAFGYLMDVRPERFAELKDLFLRTARVRGTTLRTLVMAGLQAVEAYRALHSQGIAYRDINYGNIAFDPKTADVLICDNDNAVEEGMDTSIVGTIDFMAPELIAAGSRARPNTQSDLHSLAVLLFHLLMNHHPLNGARQLAVHCLNPEAKEQLYGKDAVFIYDPDDASNRPDELVQTTVGAQWAATPETLRKLFTEAFTTGLHTPSKRVRETQWRDAFARVLDAAVRCAHCGKDNLVDPGAAAGTAPTCWKCGRQVVLGRRLKVTAGRGTVRAEYAIALQTDAKVYAHHLVDEPERHDFSAVVGEVTEHPREPGLLGLTNRSRSAWTVRLEDGSTQDVPPGRTAALQPGHLLEFGGGTEARVTERA